MSVQIRLKAQIIQGPNYAEFTKALMNSYDDAYWPERIYNKKPELSLRLAKMWIYLFKEKFLV